MAEKLNEAVTEGSKPRGWDAGCLPQSHTTLVASPYLPRLLFDGIFELCRPSFVHFYFAATFFARVNAF
jgi:hypothetical protein